MKKMLNSRSLISRKGPLGNIWIASFGVNKLNKHQIASTDITSSIDTIIPEVQISYRVLAQLLLGFVRIFSKKVDYLFLDCNEAAANLRRSLIPRHTTAQRTSTSGPHPIAQKKADTNSQHNVVEANKVTHLPEENVSDPKNGSLAMQMEAICASYHDVTITLPKRFELDAFDLDFPDGGFARDPVKPHMDSILEDEWANEKDRCSLLNEGRHMEVDIHFDHKYDCFSPVNDVNSSIMMDFEIGEFYNSSSVEVRLTVEASENHGGLSACNLVDADLHDKQQEHLVTSVNLQHEMPTYIQREVYFDNPDDQVEPVNLHVATSRHDEESHDLSQGNSEGESPANVHNKSSVPYDSGLHSPKFEVATPVRKETRRICRKRKILLDRTIVLSNGTMSTWIHDPTNLVSKRRKVPHTFLDAWRAYRIAYFQQSLMEHVIPNISSEHRVIFQKDLSNYSPQKKSASFSSTDSVDLHHELSYEHIETHDSFKGNAPSDAPLPANYSEISTPDRSEVRMKQSSPLDVPASTLDIVDDELDSIGKGSYEQESGWSVRTRAAAKYLYDMFLALRERKREEHLNLDQILDGQTRTKSARFFYETLTLKGNGCIDVEQGFPYDEILISATPQLEVLMRIR